MIEQTILQLLADPKIRDEVGSYFSEWMFDGVLYKKLFRAVMHDAFKGRVINKNLLVINLKNAGLEEDSIQEAIQIIRSASKIENDDDYLTAIHMLGSFVKEKQVTKSIERLITTQTPDSVYSDLQSALSFSINTNEFYDLSDMDLVNSMREKSSPVGGSILQSSFSIVNRNSTYNGYKYGDVIVVGAPTGVGKSTTFVQEGANFIRQGFKVAHVILGDMEEFDVFVKYLAYWLQKPIETVIGSYESLMTDKYREYFSRLRVREYPADQVDIYELLSKLTSLENNFKYDAVIIDYDGNLKECRESMYTEGGTVYGALKGFVKGRCVGMIGSQIKQTYWGTEILPPEALAESSKKQNVVDFMLLEGQNPDVENLGTLHLAKVRRGIGRKCVRLKFERMYSTIKEIPDAEYKKIHEDTISLGESRSDIVIDFNQEA